jgi:hypothetical protein
MLSLEKKQEIIEYVLIFLSMLVVAYVIAYTYYFLFR